MSLFSSASSFLTLRPKVTEEPPLLVIQTGTLATLLSLGLSHKRVEVDAQRREIRIRTRTAWLFTNEYTLGFEDLDHIDYAYKAYGTSWGWSFSGFGRQDEVEVFTLSVVDSDNGKHVLCAFRGEGSVHTGWSGVLMGDDSAADFHGTQEGESRQLVNYLKGITELPIGKQLLNDIDMRACPNCGREVAAFAKKCVYCATELPPGN